MKENIILSIIMPVYGVEKYVSKCLDSIIPQLTKDTELIIVNDCTIDNSMKICEEKTRTQSNACIISHQTNGGISSARNTGILHSKGKYCWFIDSDDCVFDNAVSLILSNLRSNKDAYFFNHIRYYNNGTQNKLYNLPDGTYKLRDKIAVTDFICDILNNKYGYEVWSKIFKRELIKKYNVCFPTKITYGEDICFILAFVLNAENIVSINQPIYCYFLHEHSMMGKSKKTSKLLEMNGIVFAVKEVYEKKYSNSENMFFVYGGIMHLAILHSWNLDLFNELANLKHNSYNLKMLNDLKGKLFVLIKKFGKRNGLLIFLETHMTRVAFYNKKWMFNTIKVIGQLVKK